MADRTDGSLDSELLDLTRRAQQLLRDAERLLPLSPCMYCGELTLGRVCPGHAELLTLDPLVGNVR